ncbi:MAG: hypothetical protein ABI183_00565 [Polyangiaceae bacterium]
MRFASVVKSVAIASLAPLVAACSHASGAKDAGIPDGSAIGISDGGADAGDAGPSVDADAGLAAEDELPSSIAQDLSDRSKHLVEAIAHDDPTLAQDFVFPRDGYAASHDRSDASSIWDKKVLAVFAHDVHTLHKKMKNSAHATFLSFDLGHEVQQITPKPKDFDRPLWRVKHSKITVSVDGKTDRIDVAEMMGWRGAWYVTHLRGS